MLMNAFRAARLMGAAGLACAAIGVDADAQVIQWAQSAPGVWNSANNWQPANTPDNPNETAVIPFGASFFIQISSNTSYRIAALQMPLAGPTLNVLSGSTLTLTQPSLIESTVLLNGVNPTNQATLAVETFNGLPLSVTGSGQVVLGGSSANMSFATLSAPGNAPASWGQNLTIRGVGRLIGPHIVRGRIWTDVQGGTIDIDGASLLGEGVGRIDADLGDVFVSDNAQVSGFQMTAGPSSRFRFNGANQTSSTVLVSNSVISGFSLVESNQLALSNTTISGTLSVPGSSSLRFRGSSATLNGLCAVSSTGSFSGGVVVFDDPVSVQGTGDFLLQTSTDVLTLSTVNNSPATFGPGIRVRGRGRLGGDFNLAGSILADDPFRGLLEIRTSTINGVGANAQINATTGILAINDADVNNARITISPGSELRLGTPGFGAQVFNNVEIEGNVIAFSNQNVFNRSSINGVLTIRPGARATATVMPFDLEGQIRVNDNFSNSQTSFTFEQSGTMTGSGRVLLEGNPQNTSSAVFGTGTNVQVSLPSGLSVHGLGSIAGRFEIGGEFVADDPFGGELSIRGSVITGRPGARMRATSGDLVITEGSVITGVPLISEGGLIRISLPNFGSAPNLNELSISGRSRFEGGTIPVNNVPLSGEIEVRGGATLRVIGTNQTVDGLMRINPLSTTTTAALTFDQSASLSGQAQIRLSAPPLTPEFALVSGPANGTLSIGRDVVIAGSGRLAGRIALAGLLRADDPLRGTLDVRSPLLSRTGDGRLEIVDANASLTDCVVSGMPISGVGLGELRTSAGTGTTTQLLNLPVDSRFVAFSGTTVLANTTVKRGLDIRPGAVVRVLGTPFRCEGNIIVNSFGSSTAASLQFDQSTTLTGAGTLVLGSSALGVESAAVSMPSAASQLVLPASRALAGNGRVGGAVTLGGEINPFSPVQAFPVGQIEFSGAECKLIRSSVYLADIVDAFGFDRLSGAAVKRLDGELRVGLPTGFYPSPSDRFAVVSGATVTGQFFKVTPPPGYQAEVEYEADAAYVRLAKLCPGDMDANGVVDDADFQYFVRAYNVLSCSDVTMPIAAGDDRPNRCFGDMNRDRIVDDADFMLFAAGYDALLCP
ncbi:MAG: hypothetical protein K2Y21_09285 [Phycisphaerales bacterium]|nr:hypothetical protein [Phycisphaerales bacterium]